MKSSLLGLESSNPQSLEVSWRPQTDIILRTLKGADNSSNFQKLRFSEVAPTFHR